MAMIICRSHGNKIASFVSPKVAEYVCKNKKIDFELLTLNLNSLEGKLSSHMVDEEFFASLHHKFGLVINEKTISDEQIAFEIFCMLKSICPECLKQNEG